MRAPVACLGLLLAGCGAADRVNRAALEQDITALVAPHGGRAVSCQVESTTRAAWCVLELPDPGRAAGALELRRGGALSGGCVAQEGFAAPAWIRGRLPLARGGAFEYLRLYAAPGRACIEVAYSYG